MWKIDAIAWWLIDLFVTDNNPAPSKLNKMVEYLFKAAIALFAVSITVLWAAAVYFSFVAAISYFRHITGQ